MIRGLVAVVLTIGFALQLQAQKKKVKIYAEPSSSAMLFIDGESKGLANGKTYVIGFNERKGIVDHKFVISAQGFKSHQFTVSLSDDDFQLVDVVLEPEVNELEVIPDALIDIDKVISGLEYGVSVGANTRWKYNYKDPIDLGPYHAKMLKVMADAGLDTPMENSDDLFDVGDNRTKTPDVLIAGRVESFDLDYQSSSSIYSAGRYKCQLTVNWQVYDRYKKEIILKSDVSSRYDFDSNVMTEEFHKAVYMNFTELINGDHGFEAMLGKLAEADRKSMELEDEPMEEVEVSDVELIGIPKVTNEIYENFGDLVQSAMNASVTIIIDEDRGHGSGVILSKNGYIVTNHHVTNGAKMIDVQFSNGIMLPGELVASSEDHDLALIKVRAGGLTPLPVISNTEAVREGDEVFIVGAPGDKELSQSVSKGIVSGRRTLNGVKFIQTDTKVSPGSSGSPLINADGEIIGIINMKLVGEGIEGLSFAIDAKYIYSALGIVYE